MKTLALTVAIILGAAAPVLAGGSTVSQIQEQIALQSDDGIDRVFAEYHSSKNGASVASTRNAASEVFAQIAAQSDDSNDRYFANASHNGSGVVNATAAAIFADLAEED